MDIKDISLPSLPTGRPLLLQGRLPFGVVIFVLLLFVPAAWWLGWGQPSLLKDFMQPWPAAWAQDAVAVTMAGLLLIPLIWVTASRTLDLFALFLAQNSLILAGYYFLNSTAWNLSGAGAGILKAGSLMVFINSAGFVLLFGFMGATYLFCVLFRAKLPPLRAQPEFYDERLTWFLRAAGLSVALVLAFPMVLSGTIPLLADDPVLARANMVQSDAARPLYHAGTAVLPFVTGGLLMIIIRRPYRVLGFDGWITGAILLIQILTSNRLPLAITLFATVTLLTLEKKFPRVLLAIALFGFLIVFAGLSGFTALVRQDRTSLQGGNVISKSLEEAFLGDNLIDLRDGSWVVSQWDMEPLGGITYLGGLVSMVPSGIFPKKKEWHLGMNALRIVGWEREAHFGLRITFFGESYLNFGPAGVAGLALVLGVFFGVLLRALHVASAKRPACLHYNLKILIMMQMAACCCNTGDAFNFWGMCAFLLAQWITVDLTLWYWDKGKPRGPFGPLVSADSKRELGTSLSRS